MKKLLLSVFVLSAASTVQAQWTEQATAFTNESRGVSQIDIVDANTVWCLAYDGVDPVNNNIQEFTRTADGGATWIPGAIDVGGDLTQEITNVSGASALVCFAGYVSPTAGLGGVVRTTDGGTNWSNTNSNAYTSATSFFNVVHAFNENDIITMGDPIGTAGTAGDFEIYTSNDGGENWDLVPGSLLTPPAGTVGGASGEYGYNGGNVGVGDAFWFVTNKGALYRTLDKGASWNKFTNVAGLTDFSATTTGGQIFFSSATNGILIKRTGAVATATYQLYQTSNGGESYTLVGPYTVPYRSLAYVPGTNTLVGTGGTTLATYASAYSPDNGVTWNIIDTEVQRTAVDFIDGATGWMGGFNISPTEGGIYKYSGPALSIPGVAERPQFSVSPNPTAGMINVVNENAGISEVTVYDLLGKQVYNAKYSAMNQVNIDLGQLTTGAYILKASADTGATQTIKIMKN